MKTITTYTTCDYDVTHTGPAEEMRFRFNGTEYAIDLCESCMSIYANLMTPYVASGHRAKFLSVVQRDMPKMPPKAKAKPTKHPKSGTTA